MLTVPDLSVLFPAPVDVSHELSVCFPGCGEFFVAFLEEVPPDYESVGQPSTSISTKTRRSILPVALRGSSSMNTTSRGTLWRARLFLT